MTKSSTVLNEKVTIQREYSIQEFVDRFHTIYSLSFPKAERVALPTLITTIDESSRWLFTVRADSQLVGFATTIPLHRTDMHFGEYIAVDSPFRSSGAGGKLHKYVTDYLQEHTVCSGSIFEVESPQSGSPEERQVRERRLKFFLEKGVRPVPGAEHYRAPDLNCPGFVDMKLMWVPFPQKTVLKNMTTACKS